MNEITPNDINEFYDNLRKTHQKITVDVNKNFLNLVQLVGKLDPIKLLSQLTLTFLFVPEGQFIEDNGGDTVKWLRWIEFLAGYLLSKNYPKDPKTKIDGVDLGSIEKLLDEYFNSVSAHIITSVPCNEEDKKVEEVVHSAKIHSLYVRGEAYPHQLREMARSLYSQHDKWFIDKLGFTINDAIAISDSILNEYNIRINKEKHSCLKYAKEHINDLIKKGEADEKDRKELENNLACYCYFGNSDKILTFSIDDIIELSGFSRGKCTRYLDRLSQKFGYKNANHQDVFNDPHSAPWDYNALYERPIISHNNMYFVPVPSLFSEVLLQTFYYDLIADNDYWKNEGERKYGVWLEQETAALFKSIFPESEVFLNPSYPNGNELCDVLILHDRKVFVIQCKTKRLRYESQIGKSFELIKEDLTKGVKESFEQANRARNYFYDNDSPIIKVSGHDLVVDAKQISDIFQISVTLHGYQSLTTRLANINPSLKLFSDNQYPWAISLLNLGLVVDIIEYPSMFIHYAKRRLAIERTKFRLMGADELDLLGFYLLQGLYFEIEDFKKADGVGLSGYSEVIDKYVYEKYECEKNVSKPRQKMPAKFRDYILAIENLSSAYKTDCAMRILDLDYQARELFVGASEQTKEKTRNDDELHSFSTVMNNSDIGISFISMNANGKIDELYKQVFSFAVMKKYMTKSREWVCFGWDKNSKQELDIAVFLSFDWHEDPELARIAKENMKTGQMIDIKKFLGQE